MLRADGSLKQLVSGVDVQALSAVKFSFSALFWQQMMRFVCFRYLRHCLHGLVCFFLWFVLVYLFRVALRVLKCG